MSDSKDTMKVTEDIYVMAEEPIPGSTPDMVREIRAKIGGESGLAQAYATANNQAWWSAHEVYDYAEGSCEKKEAIAKAEAWFALSDELASEILDILRAEGVKVPKTAYLSVLIPFMERNGIWNGNGWWFGDEDDDDE